MSKKKLLKFIESGNGEKVKQFLEDNPTSNVNEDLYGYGNGWTALHLACCEGYHEVISVLLAHPQINVNQKSNDGSTPLLLGCWTGQVEVVKVLLRDSRLDINVADIDGCIPLWLASRDGRVEVIKWMIALRGDNELELDKKGKYYGKEYTAIEIARNKNKTEVVLLLERFIKNQAQTRHEIRIELGLVDKDAAELFAMTVFLCDDFLRLKEANSPAALRFFKIAKKLPMELQMMLCYRVFGSAKENIKSKDSEPAFKRLAKTLITKSFML
jgi:hypothetical protein